MSQVDLAGANKWLVKISQIFTAIGLAGVGGAVFGVKASSQDLAIAQMLVLCGIAAAIWVVANLTWAVLEQLRILVSQRKDLISGKEEG